MKTLFKCILSLMVIIPNYMNAMLSLPLRATKLVTKSVHKTPKPNSLLASKKGLQVKKSKPLIQKYMMHKSNGVVYKKSKISSCNSVQNNIIKIAKRSFLSESDYNSHIKKMENECMFIIQDYEKILKSIDKKVRIEDYYRSLIMQYSHLVGFDSAKGKITRNDYFYNKEDLSYLSSTEYSLIDSIHEASMIIKQINKQGLLRIINTKNDIITLSLKKILQEIDLDSDESISQGIEKLLKSLKDHFDYIMKHIHILHNIMFYNCFYISFTESMSKEDIKKEAKVKKSNFIALVVQASKISALDKNPFQELIDKIKKQEIDISSDYIYLTKKDMYYRLLSYIPTSSGWLTHSLVNGESVIIREFIDREEIKKDKDYFKDMYFFIEKRIFEVIKERDRESLVIDDALIKEFDELIK